jgi:hypothetical protein
MRLLPALMIVWGPQAAPPPFIYQNPVGFSYPYFDGTNEMTTSELRDPAIIREGDTYYLVFTHFPFCHHIAVFQGPDGKEWFSYRGESGDKLDGRLCFDPIQFNEDGSVRPFKPSTGTVVIQ